MWAAYDTPTHTVPYIPQNTYDVAHYDADDFARDNADLVGCPAALADAPTWCRDSINYLIGQGGTGATIYSIGLGNLTINNREGGGVIVGGLEVRINPNDPDPTVRAKAGYDAGDDLLRYLANVGADGNPDPSVGPDACQAVSPPPLDFNTNFPNLAPTLPTGDLSCHCGNYYFVQMGADITFTVEDIAARIWPGIPVVTNTPTATDSGLPTVTPTLTPTP